MLLDPLVETFLEVAECGSFSKASERLFISAPAVMKQVNAFEERVGEALFARSSKGVSLTKAGETLRDGCLKMRELEQGVMAGVRTSAVQEKERVLRIGISQTYPVSTFAWFQKTVGFIDPSLRINLVPFEGSLNEHVGDLGNTFDMALGITDSKTMLQSCASITLGTSGFCITVPAWHPLAKHEKVGLSDLNGMALTVMEPGSSDTNDALRNKIEAEHPSIKIIDVQPHYDLELFNRCEKEGRALLNIDVLANVHPGLKSLPLDEPYSIPLGLIYAPGAKPLVEQLLSRKLGDGEDC